MSLNFSGSIVHRLQTNTHVAGCDETEFVALREARDGTLSISKVILHALQVNICGGRLPKPEPNGRCHLKIPLDALGGAATDLAHGFVTGR